MIKQTIRIFVVMFVMLFHQTGCGMAWINEETTDSSIVVKKLVETSQSWDGSYLPLYPQGQPKITILRITIPAATRLETHQHPVLNAGVLLSGQLTVKTREGKTLYLKAGDPIIEVMNVLHYGINQGTVPAEIIVFYAGDVDTPITVVEPR